jgi:hypothetical protein
MSDWVGGRGNDDFNNPVNWSTDTVPVSATPTIGTGSTVVLTQNQLLSGSGGASLSGTGVVTIAGDHTLQIDSNLHVMAGETLVLSGSTIEESTGLLIAGNGTFEVSGGSFSNSANLTRGAGQDLDLKNTNFSTNSPVIGAGTIILDGSTLNMENNDPATAISFAGSNNVLDIPYYSSAEGPLENLGFGDTIHTAPGDTLSLVANHSAGGYELVDWLGYMATISTNVSLAPRVTPSEFVNKSGNFYAICFMAGTAIATPDGQVPVETLKIGDLVTLADGRAMPMTWLGKQAVSTRFADPMRVLPIRIKADALGDGIPRRDLLASPEHAFIVDGILVQAGALVNGVSILRESDVPEVFTYYHVELADHSLVLAENVPAESFVNHVERMAFDNWAEYQARYGYARDIVEMSQPRAKSYRQVPPSIRNRLMARAMAIYGLDVSSAA